MANCVIYEDPRLVRGGAKCAQGGTVCTGGGGVVACPLKIQMMVKAGLITGFPLGI